jgi:hypothetical protein
MECKRRASDGKDRDKVNTDIRLFYYTAYFTHAKSNNVSFVEALASFVQAPNA